MVCIRVVGGDNLLNTMNDFSFNHEDQVDALYETYTASQIKQMFDSRGAEIRTFINNLINTLNSTEGAGNIALSPITDFTGSNVQTVLQSVHDILKSKIDSSAGADFIGATPINGVIGDTIQTILEGLKALIDDINSDQSQALSDYKNLLNSNDGATQIKTSNGDTVQQGLDKKVNQGEDFIGSWFGISNPTYADPGLANVVAQHTSQLADITYILRQPNIDTTGTNDCTSAVQAFFDMVANAGGGIIDIPSGTYSFDSTLKYYPNRITLRATKDVVFNFRMSSGVGMLIQPDRPDPQHYNQKHYIEKIRFTSSNFGVTLVRSEGKVVGIDKYMSAFWTIKNCTFANGNIGVSIGSYTWCTSIENSYFVGSNYGFVVDSSGLIFGENLSLTKCTFDSILQCGVLSQGSSSDTRLINCSLDYCRSKTIDVGNNAVVYMSDCYVENKDLTSEGYPNNTQWIVVEGSGILKAVNLHIIVTSDLQKEIFLNDTNNLSTKDYMKGLVIDGLYFYATTYTPDYLVSGNGRCVITNYITSNTSKRPLLSKFMNEVTYGNMLSSAIVNEADSLSNYTKPAFSNNSLDFNSTTNQSIGCALTYSCNPGEDGILKLLLNTTLLSNNRLTIVKEFLDKNYNNILTSKFPNVQTADFEADYSGFTEQYGMNPCSLNTEQSVIGKQSVKFVYTSGAYDYFQRTRRFNIKTGHQYIAIARVMVTAINSCSIQILNGSTGVTTLGTRAVTAPTSNWDYVYTVFTATADNSNYGISLYGTGISATGYFDDFWLIDLTEINPGFDITYIPSVYSFAVEFMGNKTVVNTNQSDYVLKHTSSWVNAPQGTKYLRYSLLADNLVTGTDIAIKECVLNIF